MSASMGASMGEGALLEVRDLKVEFDTYGGVVHAVRGVSFDLHAGKTLAIVGESGCGKSVTVQALMGLIPRPPGRIRSGSARLQGRELLNAPPALASAIRGNEIGMIFQDPMTSLNPTMTLGRQIGETLRIHRGLDAAAARKRAIQLMDMVQIPKAAERVDQYPFQFSGGMRQRVMIAMAIACGPRILIADEPTTALDVTIQAQILTLLKELQSALGMSIILITHDLGVVARMADDVSVMYGGQIVESGSVEDIFYRSAHPYTVGLRSAMPAAAIASAEQGGRKQLVPIEGSPPDLFSPPAGCAYFDRCPNAMRICERKNPVLAELPHGEHRSRCWLQHSYAPETALRGMAREII